MGELSFATYLSNNMATNIVEDKDIMINEQPPTFIWVLRNFAFDNIDPELGKKYHRMNIWSYTSEIKYLVKMAFYMEYTLFY